MSNNKSSRIAKNTLLLYFRMLFLMCISLYTGRVVLEALGVEDYGIYNVVGGFVSMFALISAALTSACTRFLNYEMGRAEAKRLNVVFSTSVTIQYSLAIIIAVLCEIIGVWYVNNVMVLPADRLTAANWCFQISILDFCFKLITVPYNAAIIAHERMKTFAYVSVFEGIAKLAVCYLIMMAPFDRLIFYAILLFSIQFAVRSMYQMYCRKHFPECQYHFEIDKSLLKLMFKYTGWHFVGNSAGVLRNHGVNLLLNFFFGPAVNAARAVASHVLSAVQGFAHNFMMALNPQITQSYARGDLQYMFNLIYKGSRFSYYILFLISLPVIINADYLLNLWLKEVPDYSVAFVQLSLISVLIASLTNTLITAQNATGNVRNYQLVVGGINLLNLPFSYIAILLGSSPTSVIVVAIIVEILALLARIFMIPRYIPEFNTFDFTKRVILNCFFVTTVSALVPFLMVIILPESFLSFALNVFVSLVLTAISILFIGCQKRERLTLISKVKTAIKKKIR